MSCQIKRLEVIMKNVGLYILLALALLAFAACAGPGTAPTSGIEPVRSQQLTARHSGKCLDVAGASQANSANIIQYDCHGGPNQQWRLIPQGQGYYTITAQHSGKCLDVAGASQANGSHIIQYDCHRGFNQQWRLK